MIFSVYSEPIKHIALEYGNLSLVKDLITFVRPYRGKFFVGTFFRLTSDIVWLFPVWAISEIINFATKYHQGDSLHYFWTLTIWVAFTALYRYPAQDFSKYLIYQISERVGIDARLKTIAHMFTLNALWHEKENSGNKIRRLHNGGDGLSKVLRLYVDLVIESTVSLVAVSIIFFGIGPGLAGILGVFYVTYMALSLTLTRRAKDQTYKANVEWEILEGLSFEAVNNIFTVKVLRFGKKILWYLDQASQRLMEEIRLRIFRYRTREAALNLYSEIFRQLMILYTVWNVFAGRLEVGVIAMVLLYYYRIRESAGEFAQVANEWVLARVSVMRMKDILNEKPSIELAGRKVFPKDWKAIHVRDLHFSYGGRPVLKDFSLEIKRGQRVGIVGLSGEGKSTLFKLLLKLYDDYTGSILFDAADLRDIRIDSFMDRVAVVPQETELFNFSLRENITMRSAMNEGQKKRFERALSVAHILDFMHKLPSGVESLIGEKGIKLSGGERQRVGIARAIYRQPQILLLDEATSHLDIDSEKNIQAALHEFFQETTAIVIAHRLSTIKEMDKIVIIREGRVAEEGSFDELMARQGEFHRLWERQRF